MVSALDLVDDAIADLLARLNLDASAAAALVQHGNNGSNKNNSKKQQHAKKQPKTKAGRDETTTATSEDQPDICKLEFKVGLITNVWLHETADKLYCEEIDVGEPEGPRQIASGLRAHFTLEQMKGQRLLVVANLKPKSLLGFKSHGMVLCAAQPKEDGSELVEFVEPPPDAPIGEVVTFEGLPTPQPLTATQVEKKKIFAACSKGMTTNDGCEATWNGHRFMTSTGVCKAKSIAGGQMR